MPRTNIDHTLFVMLPGDIDALVAFTEHTGKINTEWARGYALYRYLFDRRSGLTHQEAMDELAQIDYQQKKAQADELAQRG